MPCLKAGVMWSLVRRISARTARAEISTARQVFPEIQSNSQLLQLIAGHMNLNPEALGDDERVLVYCEYQKLQEMGLEPWGKKYRVIKIAQGQSAQSKDQSQKGWTSVDLNEYVMSMSVQTLVPTVSSVPFRDIKPQPPAPVPPIIVSKVEFPKVRYQVLDSFPNVRYCASRFERSRQAARSRCLFANPGRPGNF